jgi:hypothetical protein
MYTDTGSPSLWGKILDPLRVFSLGIRRKEPGKERAWGVLGDPGKVGREGEVAVRS